MYHDLAAFVTRLVILKMFTWGGSVCLISKSQISEESSHNMQSLPWVMLHSAGRKPPSPSLISSPVWLGSSWCCWRELHWQQCTPAMDLGLFWSRCCREEWEWGSIQHYLVFSSLPCRLSAVIPLSLTSSPEHGGESFGEECQDSSSVTHFEMICETKIIENKNKMW